MNELREKLGGRLNPQAGGAAYTVCAVTFFLVQLVMSLIIKGADIPTDSDAFKYLSYLSAPIGLAAGCAVMLAFTKQKFSWVAPVKCHPKYYFIALLMIFGLAFCVSNVNVLFVEFLKLFGYVPRTQESYVPDLSGGLIAPALIVIAVIPAVFEEFLFRGVILRNMQNGAGDISAILLTGLSFALFHGSAEQTVYQFICGCSFAFVAVRSGSILPSVVMHFLNNAVILVLYACGIYEYGQIADIVLISVGGAAFAAALALLIFDKKPFTRGEKGGTLGYLAYASIGLAVFLALWIASLISCNP